MRPKLTLGTVIFILCLYFPHSLIAQVSTQDSLALVDLYNATNGAHWINHTNWLSVKPVSNWYGVVVKQKRVYSLTLAANNLGGSISVSIGNLSAIVYLSLNNNKLIGKIPVEVGSLKKLIEINLQNNKLTDTIPSSLGNLKSVTSLYLSSNQLTGSIPVSIGKLINLDSLDLGNNKLAGSLPTTFNNLHALILLKLDSNQLGGVIPDLDSLIKLKALEIEYNDFTFLGMAKTVRAFPFTRYSPQGIISLNNNGNRLSVSAGGGLSLNTYNWYRNGNLYKTKTGDSAFSTTADGSYYVTITNFDAPDLTLYSDTIIIQKTVNRDDSLALVSLYNSTNGMNWTNRSNWLTNVSVTKWYGVTIINKRVTQLSLINNNLTGPIPASIKNLTQLNYLDLSQNNLNGKIPVQVGDLDSLDILNLSWNQLSGKIPAELGNLKKLHYLNLELNQLSGNMPGALGKLSNLNYLFLMFNNLSGSIPVEIDSLTNLIGLGLGSNNFTGSISVGISKFNQLEDLDLSHNQLTGNIPVGLDTNLTDLELNNNQLTGSIPADFEGLSHLIYLELGYNQLTGGIPQRIFKSATLSHVYFNNNLFSVPTKILGNTRESLIINMENNQFNFSELEQIAQRFFHSTYSPQANIKLKSKSNILYAPAGGTLTNNTYKWYNNDSLVASIYADSTFQPAESGNYHVAVTNGSAIKLTLYSDTVSYSMPSNLIASNLNNNVDRISVYPNPVNSDAALSFYTEGKYLITVTNDAGKVLLTKTGMSNKTVNQVSIDVSSFSSGIYLINVMDEKNKRQSIKFVKQ